MSLVRNGLLGAFLAVVALPAAAQAPVAVDDAYTALLGTVLQVEEPGVMENDDGGNGEPPPTATASWSNYVSHGVLDLRGDGSFDYTPDQGFVGVDTFTYEFVDGSVTSNTATVTISVDGCEPGLAPTQWVCWVEQAYYAKAVELGLNTIVESFEDVPTWEATRSPTTVPSVVSQGITWASNFSFNNITTGNGQARSGNWGFYSLPHGDQSGALTDPVRDGFTGTASAPDALLGVGGWIVASQVGSRIDFIVTHDGGATTNAPFRDHSLAVNHRFFGFIDTAGFTSFEVVETDGVVNQPYFVFGDDFSLLTAGADMTEPQVVGIGSPEESGDGVLSEGKATSAAITELTVDFSEAVQDLAGDTDPDDVTNPANYLLFDDGGDGFETFDCAGGVAAGDNLIDVTVLGYLSGHPSQTRLEVNGGFSLPAASYRLLVCGTTSIVDWAGNVLDGNGDGTGGDDFVRNFDVTVTVNHPPVANPQSVSTPEDTALAITLTGSDLDGDPISFFIATPPSNGSLSGVPPNVTYTPFADTSGLDTFTFEVEDDSLISTPATVTIDVLPVNDPPVANDQVVTTPTNAALAITLTGSDIEGDLLTFAVGTGPANGVLSGTPPNLSYSANPGYTGPDSFTFTAYDGAASSSVATVSITVTAVNYAPVAVADSSTTDEDTATSIAVLGNDDLGDEPTTITSVTQGAKGSVVIDPGATSVTYTPNLNTTGADSFNYTITDADLQTSTAIVSMTVNPMNDAPVANAGPDQTIFVTDSVTLDGSESIDVDGDPLTYEWSFSSVPAGSTATLSDTTAVMPTFVVDLTGAYFAELIVSDGTLFSVADTVSISTDNSPPVANAGPDQTAYVTDTVTLDGSASSDIDGDPLTYAWTFTSVPSGSTVSFDDSTAVMPNFDIDRSGNYFIRLVVHDGTTFSLADIVKISTLNSAPVADAGPDQATFVTATVTLDGSGSFDPDGDFFGYTWSFSSVPAGSAATLSNVSADRPTFVVDLPGLYVVQLVVFDGFALSDPDTVTISTDNTAPVADPQTVFTAEDNGLGITLTGSDADGHPISFAIGTGPTNGALNGTPPNLTYIPGPNFFGPDSFTFTASDATLSSPPATVSITVTSVNDIPLAAADSSTTDEDTAISIAVLGNDDLGDEPTTITSVTQGAKGSVTIDPGATSVTYTPNADINGADSFTYTISDADAQTSTATVSMTVDAINDAPVADAGHAQTAFVTDTVTLDGGGSSDIDGDALTFAWSISSEPAGSAASLSSLTAVMPTFVIDLPGDYVVELIVSDGTLFSIADTVTISTDNSPPVANAGPDQSAFVTDTVFLDGTESSDVDGDPLTYAWSFSSVPAGSAASLSDTTAEMPTFAIDLPGTYVVQLIVNDGTVSSAPDTVAISTDNTAPVADAGPDQSAFVTDTVTLDGTGSSDADGDPLTFAWSFSSVPVGSTATLSSLTAEMPTFVVDLPGTYVVQLIVNDGTVSSAPDTVSISTDNSVPTADPQSVLTAEDTGLGITLTGSDADGDALTFAIATGPSNGTLTGTPPNVTYTPGPNYFGGDSFTYTASDATLTSAPATVSINVTAVNDIPLAADDAATTDEDTAISIAVLGNDDLGDEPTTITSVTQGAKGSVTIDPGATSLTYTPNADTNGADSFTYTITDADLQTSTATVSMTVDAINDAPVADAGPARTVFVTDTVTLDGSGSSDIDGDALTYGWSFSSVPAGSAASLSSLTAVMPTFVVDLPGNYVAELTVSDGLLFSVADTVTISTDNSPPVADAGADQSAFVTDTVFLDGTGSSDVDGDPLTYAWSFSSVPAGSAASLSSLTAVMPTFVIDLQGDYVVELIVSDGTLFSIADTVTISTDNSAPAADPQSVSTSEDTALEITLTGSDPDGDAISFEVVNGPTNGALTGTEPNLTYNPSGGYVGPDSFVFRTFDGSLYSDPATISITVTPAALPVLTIGDASIAEPDSGTASVTVVISVSELSSVSIAVDFATADGSAVAGADYVADSGTLTIPALATSYDLVLDVTGDLVNELDETFSVSLSSPVGAVIGTPSTGTVTIVDNDPWTWFVATDGHDSNDCETALTACRTISEAVSRTAAGDLVNVARGVYLEHLVLDVDLILAGEPQKGTVIDGGGSGVVIDIAPATTVIISRFEITGGASGGIANQGDLTLLDSWVHDNGDGSAGTFGGLSNLGTALIDRVAITANIGETVGGVLNTSLLGIWNSTISGNGGGIENLPGAILEMHYSTVALNGGLGIRVGGTTSLRGTIVADHTTANCDASITTLGHNLEDADSCGLQIGASDLIGVDPLLAPLGFNGGSSPAQAITIGSPAIDAAETAGGPATDQRGVARPIDGNLDGAAESDIGACEFIPGIIFGDGFESGDTTKWSG